MQELKINPENANAAYEIGDWIGSPVNYQSLKPI